MTLQQCQLEFADALTNDTPFDEWVREAANLQIYRNNTESSLLRTLTATYPLLSKLLGEDYFAYAAKTYVEQYPSRSSNLHDYGKYFANFLKTFAPIDEFPYLPTVAEFEWICHRLHFASDANTFDLSLLSNVTPADYHRLYFELHPASNLLASDYPLLEIIDFCQKEPDTLLNLTQGPHYLQIIRRHLDIVLVPLTHCDFVFLQMLQDGMPVKAALSAALMINPSFNLAVRLPSWLQNKTIVDAYCRNPLE